MSTKSIGDAQNTSIRVVLWKGTDNPPSASQIRAAEQAAIAYFGGWCAYCGRREPAHFDHAVPSNRENCIGNRVPTCEQCNGEKGGSQDFPGVFEPSARWRAADSQHCLLHGSVRLFPATARWRPGGTRNGAGQVRADVAGPRRSPAAMAHASQHQRRTPRLLQLCPCAIVRFPSRLADWSPCSSAREDRRTSSHNQNRHPCKFATCAPACPPDFWF